MRSGKMIERMKGTLTALSNEIKSPHHAQHLGSEYRIRILFHNSTEGENFKELLFSKLGFHRIRVELNEGLRYYCIVVTWNDQERDYLIENIERYLQEDNMGPTNINRENTKFYAIVTDKDGNRTAYEIAHPSLDANMTFSVYENSITYTLEFEQEDLRAPSSCFEAWWSKSYADELDKLKKQLAECEDEKNTLMARNDVLKARLSKCENQLRNACELLNGYGEDINITKEILNLNYFSSIVNYTNQGENKRREFGKKVAEQVKRRASYYGVWREPGNARMMVDDNKILDDAVESAMNPFYISSDYVKADRIYTQNPAFDASALCKSIQLSLNSWYGTTAAYLNEAKTKPTPIFNAYDSIKDVKFANPATIVFWKDGTKTVVKAQGDEQYVPEVGLAMCICKKVMGNTRDYYRVFKHWMKKV